MKIKTILTLLSVFFLNTGCASTDNTDFQEERKKKLDKLNEDCDFATVELVNIAAIDSLVLALVECSRSSLAGIFATNADKC